MNDYLVQTPCLTSRTQSSGVSSSESRRERIRTCGLNRPSLGANYLRAISWLILVPISLLLQSCRNPPGNAPTTSTRQSPPVAETSAPANANTMSSVGEIASAASADEAAESSNFSYADRASLAPGQDTGEAESPAIQNFPSEPPTPTSYADVPGEVFQMKSGDALGKIADHIGESLESAGYTKGFYLFHDGFAVVSSLEQIDVTGHSLPPPDRFSMQPPSMRTFSISQYLSRLLSARPGYFRLFVILVCSPGIHFSTGELTAENAVFYSKNGLTKLSGPMRDTIVGPDEECLALVYEFRKANENAAPVLSTEPTVSAREHLQLAGIWKSLGE